MAKLTYQQAGEIEAQMRAIEADPALDKRAMRLFMQDKMPCGHYIGALLTCDSPPFGCVECGEPDDVPKEELTNVRC